MIPVSASAKATARRVMRSRGMRAGRPLPAKLRPLKRTGRNMVSNRSIRNPRSTFPKTPNVRRAGPTRTPNLSRGRKVGFGAAAGTVAAAGVMGEMMSKNTPWTSSYQALTGSPNFMRTAGKASIQTAFSSRQPIIRRGNVGYYGGKWVSGPNQGVNPVNMHRTRRLR